MQVLCNAWKTLENIRRTTFVKLVPSKVSMNMNNLKLKMYNKTEHLPYICKILLKIIHGHQDKIGN